MHPTVADVLDATVGFVVHVLNLCTPEGLIIGVCALMLSAAAWAVVRTHGAGSGPSAGLVVVAVWLAWFLKSQSRVPQLDLATYGVQDDAATEAAVADADAPSVRVHQEEDWGAVSVRDDGWFQDSLGRVLLLRGVNLGGASKVPVSPDGATFRGIGDPNWTEGHRSVSFVGRPFPLEQADDHLARLRAWGLTFVRFVVTWEAVEHAGPGVYDHDYLQYVLTVVRRMRAHGISCFIDPHQDVWSRFSGGDGAPGWTLEVGGWMGGWVSGGRLFKAGV
jgi:hypothetical protein